VEFLCCPFDCAQGQGHIDVGGMPTLSLTYIIMKADLVNAASQVIPNQQILVNMVSRRVRQLSIGHRPLVEFAPGLGLADIALTEIANGKLIFESTFGQNGNGKDGSPPVVEFPGVIVTKAKKKAA
jgi:DNA-directed RNA polymerase subunit omega